LIIKALLKMGALFIKYRIFEVQVTIGYG